MWIDPDVPEQFKFTSACGPTSGSDEALNGYQITSGMGLNTTHPALPVPVRASNCQLGAIVGISIASFLGLTLLCACLVGCFLDWLAAKYGYNWERAPPGKQASQGVRGQEKNEAKTELGPYPDANRDSTFTKTRDKIKDEARSTYSTQINAPDPNTVTEGEQLLEMHRKLHERRNRLLELERLDREDEALQERMRIVGVVPGR
ncbi:hypothetical protein V8F20_009963 [Naviculisporaceae sp. PSN 640]